MTTIKNEYKCPNCKSKNRVKVYDIVNEEKIDKIINRELFSHKCKNCGNKIVVDYPLIIDTEKYKIIYTPGSDTLPIDEIDKTYRLCDTYDDLKEKIMLLNDDLNDIVLEFIKSFFYNQLEKEIKDNVEDIRYDGINGDNIVLYLVGASTSIACPLDFYKKILRKTKKTKNKKCLLVDKNTYEQYFKMRLI